MATHSVKISNINPIKIDYSSSTYVPGVYNGTTVRKLLDPLVNRANHTGTYVAIKRNDNAINPPADIIPESEVYTTMSCTRPDVVNVQALVTLLFGDEIYCAVENTGATDNIAVSFLNIIVQKATT